MTEKGGAAATGGGRGTLRRSPGGGGGGVGADRDPVPRRGGGNFPKVSEPVRQKGKRIVVLL